MDQNLNAGQVQNEAQVIEAPKVSHQSSSKFAVLKNKKLWVLGLILLALPLTVGLVLMQKDTQSHASATTTVSFNPTKIETVVGNNVNLDIYVYPGENLVNSLKLAMVYDPRYLQTLDNGFTLDPTSPLTILEGPTVKDGIISVTLSAGSDPTKVIKVPTKIGMVSFLPLNAPVNAPVEVSFNSLSTVANSISDKDKFNENVISSLVPAAIYIGQGGLTPTPTRAPNTTPTPTIVSLTNMPTITPTITKYPTPTSAIISPLVSQVSINSNADSFVRSTAPNSNYGTSANLENDLSPDEISYLRFNLATLAGKNIKSAKLVLWTSDPTNSAMNLRNADDSDWSETGITYNKKPAFVNTVTSFTAKIKDAKVTLDVTSRVNSKKGTRVTFGIKSIADDSGAFYSRNAVDASKRPQLVVEYQ